MKEVKVEKEEKEEKEEKKCKGWINCFRLNNVEWWLSLGLKRKLTIILSNLQL